MTINVAKHAGFCFGVKNAVELALKNLESGKKLFSYGEIIHNPHVIRQLSEKGVQTLYNLDTLQNNAGIAVVIRSHGAPQDVYEALKIKGIEIIDATCPFVKRIHDKVREAASSGHPVVIIGECAHPEVIGIKGWAGDKAYVAYEPEDVTALPKLVAPVIVAQTTITKAKWDEMTEALARKAEAPELFLSICATTQERQNEAEALALKSNAVVVIGGANSSNTRKLLEICRNACKNTALIEHTDELSLEKYKADDIISIVAGASTPDWLIREVYLRMSENEQLHSEGIQETAVDAVEETAPAAEQPVQETVAETGSIAPQAQDTHEEDFMAAIDRSCVKLRRGQIIKGKIVQLTDDEACVNVGYKTDGIISKNELSAEGNLNPKDILNIGDEVEVEVLTVNDGQGNVLLSKKRIDARGKWNEFVTDTDSEFSKTYTCKISKVVKGGLLSRIEGYETFIPASHVGLRFVEDLTQYEGKELKVKIIDVDKRQKRIIASHKVVLMEEANQRIQELWSTFKSGDVIKGTVKRLSDFGAFVDIGGVDGLLHIKDIAWNSLKHPSEAVHEGDVLDLVVLSVDMERKRVALGRKQLLPKPWDIAPEKYFAGDAVDGKVVRIVPFGAFVELEPGIDGLIHVSQVATRRLERVEDELRIGDIVRVRILEVNPEKRKISLSRREILLDDEYYAAQDAKEAKKGDAQETERYEIPPVEETKVTLADFFPKNDE